jgi:hypothetical protein
MLTGPASLRKGFLTFLDATWWPNENRSLLHLFYLNEFSYIVSRPGKNTFVFTRVGTYVQRGSKFCFVVVVVVVVLLLGVTVIAQNIALLANFTMHSAA